MQRAILAFMSGVFCTALIGAAISVYIFHDVDKEEIGRWNEAFGGLCIESIPFTLLLGGGVALLTLFGRRIFHLKGHSPRTKLSLLLGIGATMIQYLWDFIGRKTVPNLSEYSLTFYLVAAIIICSVVLIRDNFNQTKLCRPLAASVES
jgi:uncharacterized membrane protein YeaQ/YmgE (transglycosylase-associated protein family)